MNRLRIHMKPSPVYPGLQVQMIPAGVLAQAALGPQVTLTFIEASLVIDEVRYGEVMVDSQRNSASSVHSSGLNVIIVGFAE